MKTICMERFGRAHWSLLVYVKSVCVDANGSIGQLDRKRMRCNPESHPLLAAGIGWSAEYSTRLKGYSNASALAEDKSALIVEGHDDWDCLDDLEQAGLISIISMINGFVKITKKGLSAAAQVEEHKANGGTFANFDIKENELATNL